MRGGAGSWNANGYVAARFSSLLEVVLQSFDRRVGISGENAWSNANFGHGQKVAGLVSGFAELRQDGDRRIGSDQHGIAVRGCPRHICSANRSGRACPIFYYYRLTEPF